MITNHSRTQAWLLIATVALASTYLAGAARAESVIAEGKSSTASRQGEFVVGSMSASGCNVDVCIYLTGSGLQVDRWRTTGYSSSYACTSAQFLADGVLVASTGTVCGSGTFSSTWENPGTFPDGTQLCNTWSNITGKPCKTVHS